MHRREQRGCGSARLSQENCIDWGGCSRYRNCFLFSFFWTWIVNIEPCCQRLGEKRVTDPAGTLMRETAFSDVLWSLVTTYSLSCKLMMAFQWLKDIPIWTRSYVNPGVKLLRWLIMKENIKMPLLKGTWLVSGSALGVLKLCFAWSILSGALAGTLRELGFPSLFSA